MYLLHNPHGQPCGIHFLILNLKLLSESEVLCFMCFMWFSVLYIIKVSVPLNSKYPGRISKQIS